MENILRLIVSLTQAICSYKDNSGTQFLVSDFFNRVEALLQTWEISLANGWKAINKSRSQEELCYKVVGPRLIYCFRSVFWCFGWSLPQSHWAINELSFRLSPVLLLELNDIVSLLKIADWKWKTLELQIMFSYKSELDKFQVSDQFCDLKVNILVWIVPINS